ncbi:MAG: hypothetical protein AMXMBFR33_00800 [Candidatus Xenobia bacterium]
MRFEIPLYIQGQGGKQPEYRVRPLFFARPEEHSRLLHQARSRLIQSLRSHLDALSRLDRNEELARYSYCPELDQNLLELRFEHKKRTARVRLLVVTFRALGRRLAFSPSLPEEWFEVERGQDLAARTTEVLRQFLRRKPNQDLQPEVLSVLERAWIEVLELQLDPPGASPRPKKPGLMALLGGRDLASGREELAKVGRCLSWTPDDLERCLERGPELERLETLLSRPQRAAVVVVGPRLVGKTTLIHEQIRRDNRRRSRYWQLSPQRLISGMSYLGQWESRLIKILRYVREKNVVLVLDDLLAWLTAGLSRDAQMPASEVLKSFLERQELRLLAELTPEALAVLQEKDRALADRFEVVRLDEMAPRTAMRVLLETVRKTEETQRCIFTSRAVLEVEELSTRYLTDAARPGKAARMARQLGARFRGQTIDRQQVLEQFSQRSGLSLALLDTGTRLTRSQARAWLGERVVGQPRALDALADTISVFKARLTDPRRPVAGLLFVGPTGVGKTECARALAATLYGHEDRLVRFDMNEFVGHDSVARLVGSGGHPDGLLTAALRRQPFSVVLLDEVEKAHPDALNLLLQILGDGRLTDALGRTADFTQAILIMTSNLGAREVSRSLGLRNQAEQEELTYLKAVRDYFPPELFNRIDQVIAFDHLERADLARLSERLLQRLLNRDGLVRRQCLLEVHPLARERIVDMGFDPRLGARALKRSLEREVAAPVARRLAGMPPDLPTSVRLGPELEIEVEALTLVAPRRQPTGSLEPLLEATRARLASLGPAGRVSQEDLDEQALLYFELQDLQRALEAKLRRPGKRKLPPMAELSQEEVESLWRRSDLLTALEELNQSLPPLKEREQLALERDRRATAALIAQVGRPRQTTHLELTGPRADMLEKIYLQLEEVRRLGPGRLEVGNTPLLEGEPGLHLFVGPEGIAPTRVGSSARVVRLYSSSGVLDMATGLFHPGSPGLDAWRHFWLAGLPLELT